MTTVPYMPEQAAPPHLIVVAGALASGVIENEPDAETRPTLFVAVTLSGSAGSVAPTPKL